MAQAQEQFLGAIRPTLFIGLGGTGKEVLLRLRRKFYERLGRAGLPCTAYIWIDTDTRDVMAQGEQVDEIYQAVAFEPHEQIGLLEGSVGNDLAGMFTNRGGWNNIHDWLHPEVERFGQEISDGAGGVRAVGRMTFFYHFEEKINTLISNALGTISTQQAITETEQLFEKRKMGAVQFPQPPQRQVFVVCSLAGGTGCGTVLDTAFFLRYLSQKAGIPVERYVGILFMPNVFYMNPQGEVAQRSYGNAYAALKELEFYTLRLDQNRDSSGASNQLKRDTNADSRKPSQELSIDYQVEWNSGHRVQVQGPPFSIAYIEEMKNEGGIGLDPNHRSEIFSMVAESLLLDFMPGPFSAQKRSQYSNIVQYLSGVQGSNISSGGITLPQEFARRYASFGMSKIEIPLDSLKGAAAAKLASEIAAYINRDEDDPHIMTNVRDDMAQRQVDERGLEERYTAAWKESIKNDLSNIFRGLVVKDAGQIDELENRLNQFEEQQLSTKGNDPTKWGAAIDLIRRSTNRVSQEANNVLLEWLNWSLDNDVRGLKAVLAETGYLRYMTENLRAFYTPLGEGARATYDQLRDDAQRDAEFYQERKAIVLRDLRATVKSLGVATLAVREWTITKLLERLHEAEEQHALAQAAVVLYEEAKKVAQATVRFLSERKPQMDKFQESIAGMVKSYEKKYAEFVNFSQQILFIRFFDYEQDWPIFYKLDTREVNPGAEYKRFMSQQLGGNATLTDLIETHSRQGEKETKKLLSGFSEERFWRDFDAHPRDIDVLQHPQMNDQWHPNIERMIRSAMPMLRRNTHFAGRPLQVQRRAYLGVNKIHGSPYQGFIEEVRKRLVGLGIEEQYISVQPTDKPWEVYLYLVTYAFPLSALPIVLTDCHKAYFDFYQALRNDQITDRKYNIPLHLSASWEGKFDDLLVYLDDEARRVKEARDAILFGAILKVLELTQVQGRIEYGYRLGAPAFRTLSIGPKREAVETLRNKDELRTRLLTAIAQRETNLSKEQMETYYWILQYLKFSNEFSAGSPEIKLLEDRTTKIYLSLTNDHSVGEDALELEGATNNEKAEKAKTLIASGAGWIGGLPAMSGLEIWRKPAGEDA